MALKYTTIEFTDMLDEVTPSTGTYDFRISRGLYDLTDPGSTYTPVWKRVNLDVMGYGTVRLPSTEYLHLNVQGASAFVRKSVNGADPEVWRISVPDPPLDDSPVDLYAQWPHQSGEQRYGVTRIVSQSDLIDIFQQGSVVTLDFSEGLQAILDELEADIAAETARAMAAEGDLNNLTTTEKNNLVEAINEVDYHADTNAAVIAAETAARTDDVNAEEARALGVEGNPALLTTTAKNNLVAAINEVDAHADTSTTGLAAEITRATGVEGTLASLNTTVKTSLAAAINEVDSHADTNSAGLASEITNRIADVDTEENRAKGVEGDLSLLSTTTKLNLVAAITEVDAHADTNSTAIGTLGNLSTTAKDNLVLAINEVKGQSNSGSGAIAAEAERAMAAEGDLSALTTTQKSNLVAAINEVDAHADTNTAGLATEITNRIADVDTEQSRATGVEGLLGNLTTTNQSNLVGAISEVDNHADAANTAISAEVVRATGVEGALSGLSTTNKTNLVAAVNEVDANADTNAAGLAAEITNRTNDVNTEEARAIGVEGTLASLTTTAKTNLVAAVNEVKAQANTNTAGIASEITNRTADVDAEESRAKGIEGTLASLTTTDKSSLAAAINEVDGHADTSTAGLASEVTNRIADVDAEENRAKGVEGTLASLTTTNKTNLVAAVNEVDANADANTAAIAAEVTNRTNDVNTEEARAIAVEGTLASLTTTNKTNLVAAVNEVKGQANTNATAITAETTRATGVEGSLASLTTTDKTTLVAAVNEVDAHADTNATAITAETARATGVEGSLASLTTTVKTSLVAAINEVDSHADTNTAAIATETTNRTAADTALGVRIDLSVVGAADSYDRTDSSTSLGSMPNGQVWTTSPGGNVWGLDDGMAYSPVPYAASWAVTQTARWNVDIQAPIILGTQATSEVGLAFRFVDNPNHMHACLTLVDSTGVSVVRIVRHIGNVGKVLASVDFPLTHGETYLMRVVVVDREVQVIVDDQFVVGVSLTNDEFEVLGVNGTKHGMYMGLSDTTSRIARITIQTIPTVDRFLGGEVVQDMVYSSSIDPSIEDLHATVAYPIGRRYLPVLVAIHDFTFSETYFTADILKRLAGYGMVVMAVGLRGRNGAGGLADADGREIYDIKDALDALRVQFPRAAHRVYQSLVDYGSGAGFAAAVKLPDYFAEIISYWSPSDIGGDPTYGWYQEYVAGRTAIANMVGGTPTTMPTAYASRQHRLAAGNYTGGYLRTYHDLANTVVPPDQSSRFTAAMTTAGLSNFATPHTSNTGDTVRYLQQRPDAGTGAQISEADWNNSIAAMSHAPWAIPDTGTVRVEGFLAAKAIELWLAAGQGTADEATLVYNITGRIFTVTLLGSNYIDAYKILVHGLDPNTPVNATINGTVYTETTDEGGTATFYWNVYDWMVGPFRFDQAESSPIVFPHLEAGAWGKLQGSDSGSKYSIASSKLTATTHTTAFANPYVYIMDLDDSSFERVTGYCLHFVNTGLVKAGFANESDAFTIIRSGFQLFANNDWRVLQNAATIGPMNALSSSTEYEYWIIVADFGANIYVKGGAFTEPTLLWNENFNDNGNLNRVSPGRFVINHSGGLNMQSVEAIYLGGAFSRFASLANYFHVRPVLPQSGTGLVDGFIAANYDFTTSDVVNIYFHYTDAANCWVLRLTQGSNAMDLIEYNPALGGGFAIRATTNPTLSTTGGTSRVAVRWRGARIDAICSGTNTARLNYTTAAFNLTEGGWRLPAENSPATRVRVLPLYVPGSAMPRKTGKHATNFWFIGDSKTVGSTDTDQAGGLSGYNYMFRHLWAIGQGAGANARPNQTAQGGIQVSNIIDDTFATNIPDSLDAATDTPQKVLINLTVNDSNLTDADKTTWKTQFQTGIIDAIKNKWPEEHIEFYLARMWHRGNPTGDDRINSWVEELILENPGVCFPGIDERTFLPYTFDIATSTWVYDPAGTYTGTGGGVEIATVDGTHPGHRGYKRTAEEWYKAVTGDTLVYDGV